ncbi:hypothetical protein FH972_022461 [Carpinus fangiana]|uniref:Uncharacterized protein n=1 Tax=Carpinus fangiana TaxID=176857 RepID=A0A5N6KSA7_9ROSI|nr:hypothetical protein FH972_022461 [Carpinus fangiana]
MHFHEWVQRSLKADQKNFDSTHARKLRILLSQDGCLTLESSLVPPENSPKTFFPPTLSNPETLRAWSPRGAEPGHQWPGAPKWSVAIDDQPITVQENCPDPHLHFKTTFRPLYAAARSRLAATMKPVALTSNGSALLEEILLLNEDGFVTEGSFTSVYFWRNNCWPQGLEVGACIMIKAALAPSSEIKKPIVKVVFRFPLEIMEYQAYTLAQQVERYIYNTSTRDSNHQDTIDSHEHFKVHMGFHENMYLEFSSRLTCLDSSWFS